MMIIDLALRLRHLRDQNKWTVADMAEMTGLPKRTLDKYMLRSDASLPGFEALCALSKGLGVSLDWLVFGADTASGTVELLTHRATYEVARLFAETLLSQHRKHGEAIFSESTIMTLSPEEWAADLGFRARENVREFVKNGVNKSDLMAWETWVNELTRELLKDRISTMLLAESVSGNGN
jgi:transcriptional regulator with XRE-family HTH domain